MKRPAVTEENREHTEMEWREAMEQSGRIETYPVFFFLHATLQNESDSAFEFSPFSTLAEQNIGQGLLLQVSVGSSKFY